jgi:hypothetical protein
MVDVETPVKKFDYKSMRRKYYSLTGIDATSDMMISERILDRKSTMVVLSRKDINEFEVRDWCEEHFGDDWIYSWFTFYFKYEKDATLFALRWSA